MAAITEGSAHNTATATPTIAHRRCALRRTTVTRSPPIRRSARQIRPASPFYADDRQRLIDGKIRSRLFTTCWHHEAVDPPPIPNAASVTNRASSRRGAAGDPAGRPGADPLVPAVTNTTFPANRLVIT
jgi:hypothetical protein